MNGYFVLLLVLIFSFVSGAAGAACIPATSKASSGIIGLHLLRPEDPLTWKWVEQLGPDWVRLEVHWNLVEPSPGVYQWDLVDRSLTHANASAVNVMLLVNNMPDWVVDTPDPSEAFRRLLEAFFERYTTAQRSKIKAYEIFNEPNLPGFGWLSTNRRPELNEHIDMTASAQLFSTTMKVANETIRRYDRRGLIISGGLSPHENVRAYLQLIQTAGVAACFDVFGYHPYAEFDRLIAVQTELQRLIGKPVWFTEYGTTDNALRSKLLERLFEQRKQVGAMFWFIDRDFGFLGDTYGLVDYFGRPKKDFAVFSRLTGAVARRR